ncbi:host specificity protein J [Acinetobacter guillouiae]|uniref:host specificity protein J n=1 Tax=Acinetobacter guillouiae TaxID=106649 RepID=UPI003AF61320
MLKTVKGAKGGSQSQRQPKVANDTTASKTYARLQYGMSEGEVEGLANGFKSIFLDDTPVENDSGARNFQDVTLDFRSGTNDQAYMEGFESIASETAVSVELKSDTPWVKGITNLNLDAVIVRVRFGALKQQDPSNGDVSGIVIDYSIEVQTDGGSWELMLDTQMSGKTSANYERTHRIGLPKANNNWLIRVTRKTPNSSSEYVSDKMYIQAITEVVDLKLAYPNTALIGVQYDAETFSNIAKIAVDLKGVKIKVPSNYDPVSRTYIGIWDGLFKRAYSNNPAWIYYDLCTNKRYALGNRLTEQMIDKWSLYRLAQYCDQLVPNGKGGQEPRFTCNVYIQSAESAFDILSKLAGLFRAISYWDGASIVCEADLPQDTMFTYTSANIIDGAQGINYSGTRARDRHNAIKVAWDNPQNRYKTEYVFVRDEKSIAEAKAVRLLELEAWGCTSEGQAQRTGQWALKTEQLETRTVTFKVGLDGYIPLPGKVIELADELLAGRANGGRISSVSADLKQITLDRDDVVCRAGDRLVVNGENGKAQARVVSSIAGRVVTVVSAFDSVAPQNVWVIDAQDLATMKFRVVSISQDEPHQFTINAIQHNASKYDAIDHGAYIDDRPISIINPTTQAPVESVTISSEQMVQQGMSVETMVISWPQAKDATKYQVEWRKDNGTWLKLPLTGSNSAELAGIYAGQYEARVFAISAFDISSLPTYSVLTELKGKQGKPPKLANIHAEGILFGMKLTWLFPAVGALDTAYTEIEVSPDSTSNIAQLGLFAYPTTVHTIQGMQQNLRQFYRGRLIDRIGNVGDWSDWVSGVSSADASDVLDLLNDQISESQLNKDLKEKIERIEVIDGDIADIIQSVQNVENGITQERNERIAGDDQVLNQLTIYKLSNDQKVAAVVEDVDLVMNEQEVQAKKIDGVYAQVNPPLIGSESDLIGNNSGYAGVWSEQSARIEGDLAQSIRTDQVTAQMNQNDALYQQQIKATADAVSANVKLTETIQTTVGENKASIERVSESVDGVYAQEFTKFDVNGHVAGHGAMNDGKVSRFVFNYDSISFGAPVGVDGIEVRPLMVLQNNPVTLPNGTVVPRGLYVEQANIGYVHANRIYAENLSAISAELGTIQVGSANIENGAITSLKIQDNAVTVPIGVTGPNITKSGAAFMSSSDDYDTQVSEWEAYIGDLTSITLNRQGGKVRVDASVCFSQNQPNVFSAFSGNQTLSEQDRYRLRMVLSVYRGTTLVGRSHSPPARIDGQLGITFAGTVPMCAVIDESTVTGDQKYTLKFGFAADGISGKVQKNISASFTLSQIRMSVLELRK